MPRSGPRREPRANRRGRSRRALSRPKARIVSAIGHGAGRGIPQSSRGDRTEQHDVRERGREPHRGQRQDDGARAVGAVEEDAIDDPDRDEPDGECRRGAQGSGSQRHGRHAVGVGGFAVQAEQQRDALAGLELQGREALLRVLPLAALGLHPQRPVGEGGGHRLARLEVVRAVLGGEGEVLGRHAVDAADDLVAVLGRCPRS